MPSADEVGLEARDFQSQNLQSHGQASYVLCLLLVDPGGRWGLSRLISNAEKHSSTIMAVSPTIVRTFSACSRIRKSTRAPENRSDIPGLLRPAKRAPWGD